MWIFAMKLQILFILHIFIKLHQNLIQFLYQNSVNLHFYGSKLIDFMVLRTL